jgi:eukaryotic-like serine/threonine-protein kinase
MANSGANRDLLFGLLALQNGLIDQAQLVAAFQAWTLDKERPLAEHLAARGEFETEDRAAVEALVARHLKKHGGSTAKSLAVLPAAFSTHRSLAGLDDTDLAASLAGMPSNGVSGGSALTVDLEQVRTEGGKVLTRLVSEMGTISRVVLPDTGTSDRQPTPAGGDGNSLVNASAGRYRLLGELARGGMGAVHRGRDVALGRDLALKVLLDRHRDRPDLVDRFIEEAQICGQLQHPGIVPVYELGTLADKRPFFAMKLVKGRTLAELLAEVEPGSDLPRFLSIFEAICQTAAYAHARGVIHRDLKPSNVMVGSFGEVQVMDWGLAKVLPKDGEAPVREPSPNETVVATARSTGESDLSEAGSVLGTPAYMAPEQARGEMESVDRRADVFALGSILCEILTGRPAFVGESVRDVLSAAAGANTADALARLANCGADGELLALARDCLAPRAKDRPADATVVAGRLTAFLAGVQARLRAAELSRAAESARAQEAEAKAFAERNARRLSAALAITILMAGGLGAAGWRWVELQRLEQIRGASSRVNIALQDATRLRGLAQGAPVGDIGRWEVAAVAAGKARDLLVPGVDPALRKQVEDLAAELVEERQRAEAKALAIKRDRTLLDALVDIRSAEADDRGGFTTDAAYAVAFREAGLDVTALSPAEAARKIQARPPEIATALATALDDWAGIRRNRKKDRAGALSLSDLAAAADPDAWRLGLRRALDVPDQAARLEALRSLAKAVAFDTLGPISLDLLGRALNDAGDPAGAESVLRRAQHRYPGDVWINFDLAESLAKLARRQDAIRYYTAARSLRPETAHSLAHALGDSGASDEEIAVFEDLKRLRPGMGRHLGCLGGALQNQGRSREADAILEAAVAANREAIRRGSDDAYAHFSLGVALRKQGKVDEAIAEYRVAIRIQPEDATIHDNLCEILGSQGKLDEAIAEHQTAIRLKPDFANAYNTLGYILSEVKHDEAAAAIAYREAIRLQPDFARAHNNLGRALQHLGQRDEALAEYRTSCKLQPDSVEFLENLGEGLELQGMRDEAIVNYRTGIGIRPDSANVHNDLAWVLVKTPDCTEKDRVEALEHARQAVALSPRAGGFQNTLGLVEYRVGLWDESIASVERSIALTDGVEVTNWFILAMVHWQRGEKDRSRSYFEQAVAWIKKNDYQSADMLTIWREAARLLGQPDPDVSRLPDLPANVFAP